MLIIMEKHNQRRMLGRVLKLQISQPCLMSTFAEAVVSQSCTLKLRDRKHTHCCASTFVHCSVLHQ